ncbi:MAG: hypothetical protein IJ567_05560 [Lachnospiraceae bacterium]|nr:hypothetical protein [Lachnospiraceae bacterium]
MINAFDIKATEEIKKDQKIEFVWCERMEGEDVVGWSFYRDFADFAQNAGSIDTYKVRDHVCYITEIQDITPQLDLFGVGKRISIYLTDTITEEKFILFADKEGIEDIMRG